MRTRFTVQRLGAFLAGAGGICLASIVACVDLDSLSADPAIARQRAENAIPLRRSGQPAEFARVAAFLLSPAASYLTGSVIPVEGGALRGL